MQTRRDRYQAHRFVARRGAYALLNGEPDSPETPLRRLGVAAITGLSVAVLLGAVFGIYGVLRPGDTGAWRQPGSLVVEKETGTRYVYVDGALHPVLNYASARLVLGATDVRTVLVPWSGLARVPHGLPVGIAGAPDSLPDVRALVSAPWTACSGHAVDSGVPTSSIDIGVPVTGHELGDTNALLVRSANGTTFLVWHGHRLTITQPAVAAALGYQAHGTTVVADAWLSGMPAGPDLRFPTVPHRGAPGPAVGRLSTRVGQVLVVQIPGVQDSFYLIRDDGLSPMTALGAALVIGDPASRPAYPGQMPAAIDVSAADVAASTTSAHSSVVTGYPSNPPSLVEPASGDLCIRFADPSELESAATVSVAPAGTAPTASSSIRNAGDAATADAVRLPVGAGVVTRAGQVTYVVTDLGVKYPLATPDLLPTLGFAGVTPAAIASTLLSLVPTGPLLDLSRARLYENVAKAGN